MAEIQIVEPTVFEVAISLPAVLEPFTVTTPPGVGLGGAPITVNYTCPLSIHCGADIPCGPNFTIPLALTIPLPVFQFPPTFDLPAFGFRVEIPPAIFINCPLLPEKKFEDNKKEKNNNDSSVSQDPLPDAIGSSISIKSLIESGDKNLKGSLVNQ